MSENENSGFGHGTADPNFGARKASRDPLDNMLDGRDDPNRGPLDRAANSLDGRDDPNRGPLDRAANAMTGTSGGTAAAVGGAGAGAATMGTTVSAIFDSQDEAQRAVGDLRSAGVADSNLSIITQRGGTTTTTGGDGEVTDESHGIIIRGILGGGALGAGLGVLALAIPGVGPLAAAGAIAASAVPEAMALGAAAGAAAGTLNEVLGKHGVSDEDASYYGERLKAGGIFVSVDTSDGTLSAERAREILQRAGGHNAANPRG